MKRRLIIATLLVATGLAGYAVIRARRDLTDFEVYRLAAERAARAESLYRPSDGHYQFKYLPAFAVLARPLTWMGVETAKFVWFAMSFGLLVAFVRRLMTALPERRRKGLDVGIWTVLIMAKFSVRELALGQTNLLLGILLLPAVIDLGRHPKTAGFATGAAIFVKPYAALFLPWLAWRERRALPSAAVAIGLGLLLPVVSYGWSGDLTLLRDWVHAVRETTNPNLLHPDNVSLASLWAKWLGSSAVATDLAWASVVVLVLAIGWACWRWPRPEGSAYLEGGLLMLAMPLLSPQGWDYVLLLSLPVVALAIDRWPRLPGVVRAALVATAVVYAIPLRWFVSVETYNAVMATAVTTLAALALFGTGLLMRSRALA